MGTRTMGSKQGPLYNLTLDEVQHQLGDLGKPLSSMNLDELLKNVWTDESEANHSLDYSQNTQIASASASGSSMVDLRKKTVDELWQDMQQGQKKKTDSKPTLGEMTLEDFLAKAGIVGKLSHEKKNSGSVLGSELVALPQQNVNPQQAQWMQYQITPLQQQQQQQQQQQVFMPGHHQVQQPIMDVGYLESQMTMSPTPLMSTPADTQTPRRKRVASGDVIEKTVERRQKRMIKNRESAARSRARKQAYTNELENKVSRLEEENERLKREQEADNALPYLPALEPKYQLRRNSSALF